MRSYFFLFCSILILCWLCNALCCTQIVDHKFHLASDFCFFFVVSTEEIIYKRFVYNRECCFLCLKKIDFRSKNLKRSMLPIKNRGGLEIRLLTFFRSFYLFAKYNTFALCFSCYFVFRLFKYIWLVLRSFYHLLDKLYFLQFDKARFWVALKSCNFFFFMICKDHCC